ncbi:MAG: RIP metalloprotease RseP [Parcubacteria group bacterium CG10_big_fil_rev_8_21_14_0_10_36_14]|nr:MAG: RIP metalloprotease RseP [Parcubacteria group bacterium CG10_big_fil_rev_8_21_14_0_10_36_14]
MLITLLIFLIVLGLIVFVHEFGHFICAKKLGAKAEEFGFGFPPRMIGIYKKNKNWKICFRKTPKADNTIYSLNWIPLGGFVKIKGEDGSDKNDSDSFAGLKIWKKAVILVAGVVMNIILAMFLLGAGYMIGLPQALDSTISKSAIISEKNVQIVSVSSGSEAEHAGLKTGDEILLIDGKEIVFSSIQDYLTQNVGEGVVYTIKRGDQQFEKTIIPQILQETGRGGVGVGLVETAIVSYPWHIAIWKGIVEALYYFKEIAIAFIILLKNLIIGRGGAEEISGPVGIAVITARVAKLGFIYILQFTALLSINLAILNIFPFPALDGGRLLFLAVEKLRGKPVSQKIENIIHNSGFALLMILLIVITYRDFVKFGSKFVDLWQSIIH